MKSADEANVEVSGRCPLWLCLPYYGDAHHGDAYSTMAMPTMAMPTMAMPTMAMPTMAMPTMAMLTMAMPKAVLWRCLLHGTLGWGVNCLQTAPRASCSGANATHCGQRLGENQWRRRLASSWFGSHTTT
eukprot:scaffold37497_cov57-Phaeocystis_antarctica.AAC.1